MQKLQRYSWKWHRLGDGDEPNEDEINNDDPSCSVARGTMSGDEIPKQTNQGQVGYEILTSDMKQW